MAAMAEVGSLLPPLLRPFGRYELLAKLANGGMAELFLARTGRDAERVVIKRVLPYLADDARFVAMFRDEARLAARIEHPNVCKVLEVGAVGDTYFMALEYLHGVPLSRLLLRAMRTEQKLDVRVVGAIGVQVAAGLHAAHELAAADGHPLDLVHRDVSPPNLFLTTDGAVKVLDFGVAKARGASTKTRTGTVKGKNAYMSPEQVLGTTTLDRRSDLFSLGICLWEALSAERLFNRDTDFMTFRAIANCDVPPLAERRPELGPAMLALMDRCLARLPDDRFATAAELGEALAAALAPLGGPASEAELAAYIGREFAADLEAKEVVLRAAESL
jgi:eukaryotic-like serine/threonine-protein kinase